MKKLLCAMAMATCASTAAQADQHVSCEAQYETFMLIISAESVCTLDPDTQQIADTYKERAKNECRGRLSPRSQQEIGEKSISDAKRLVEKYGISLYCEGANSIIRDKLQ